MRIYLLLAIYEAKNPGLHMKKTQFETYNIVHCKKTVQNSTGAATSYIYHGIL